MTNKEQRQQEWQARIVDYQASGLTMAAWCQAHSFSKEQLKYWLRKTKGLATSTAPAENSRWLPISVAPDALTTSPLVVRIGQASIEIKNNFDPYLLRKVVQALESSC